MGDAQRGDDSLAFYAATLGRTRALNVTIAPSQLLDVDGPLLPVRHLLHIADISPTNRVIWVRTGKFEKGTTLSITPGLPWFPMSFGGLTAIEINVRKEHADQIAAVMSGGNGILYITEISRRV